MSSSPIMTATPVTGLTKGDFTDTEQDKLQPLTYFEEHQGLSTAQAQKIQFPQMPPDVFTNFSPLAPPPRSTSCCSTRSTRP